jgi:hypothetical protein
LVDVVDPVIVLLDVELSVVFGDDDDVLLVIPDRVIYFDFIDVYDGIDVDV